MMAVNAEAGPEEPAKGSRCRGHPGALAHLEGAHNSRVFDSVQHSADDVRTLEPSVRRVE
jgi:hypothetical protein